MEINKLPQGWAWTSLGEIITLEYGKGLREDKRDPDGDVPVYGSNGIVGYHSTPLTKNASLIIGRKGSVGRVHLSEVPSWPIDTTYFLVQPDGLDLHFLYYLLSTLKLNTLDTSTAIPGINRNHVYAIKVPLPPLEEQTRIVERIKQLGSESKVAKESIDKIQPIMKKFRQSTLNAAFKGKLTETDLNNEPAERLLERIRRNNNDLFPRENSDKRFSNVENLPRLDDGWAWATIGELFDIIMGQSPPGTSYNIEGKGVPLLNGPTEFGEDFPTARQWTTLRTKVTENGDLLICVRGNTIGKMNWADQRYCIGRGLAAIRSLYPELDIRLLFYFLKIKFTELMEQTTGSTFPNLQKEKLNGFLFPLPPISGQAKIIERIESLFLFANRIEKSVSDAKKIVEKLDDAILAKAFHGELVPQDSNDESALILLERIKKGRKKMPGMRK